MLFSITKNNIFDFALKVFILLTPIAYIGGLPAKDVQLQFFIMGVMVLLGLSFLSVQKREYSNTWIGLILLWAVANTIIYKFHPKVISGATLVFLAVLAFYLIIKYADDDSLNWLLLLIPLNFIVVILQFLNRDFINEIRPAGIVGLMQSPSHLGVLMALLIPVAMIKTRWLILPALFCLFASRSMTPLIGLTGAMIFYYLHRKKYLIAGLFLLSPAAVYFLLVNRGMFDFVKVKLLGRFEIWEQTLRWAFTKPLYGMGMGSFGEISRTFESSQGYWETPQNSYLGILFALGIPALVVIFYYLFNLYKRAKPYFCDRRILPLISSIFGLLIILSSQSVLGYARIFLPVVFVLAFLEISIKKQKIKKEEVKNELQTL